MMCICRQRPGRGGTGSNRVASGLGADAAGADGDAADTVVMSNIQSMLECS